MNAIHYWIARWGAFLCGILLLAVPLARAFNGVPLVGVDMVLGGVGVAALLLAIEDALRRRAPRGRGAACPHCGEPLLDGA